MDTGSHNEGIAKLLIDQLVQLGVETFCVAPGSRSTALTLAVAQHPTAQTHLHFDERGLGFLAVGIAKGSRKPVAIITTSGTAVGNLMPSVMEASLDATPLIILTADRPSELRDCSANQTCDLVKLFTNFVRFQTDLPLSDGQLPAQYVKATLAHAVFLSTGPTPGPVHINCMFREPLFANTPVEHVSQSACQWETGERVVSSETLLAWAKRFSDQQGVIIVGSLPPHAPIASILTLAERLNWPIIADPLSQMHTVGHHSHLLSNGDLLVRCGASQPVNAVLQLGDRFVSKTISEWLKQLAPALYLHVAEHTQRHDPSSIVTHRLQASPTYFANELARILPENHKNLSWKQADEMVQRTLSSYFKEQTQLSEPNVVDCLAKYLTPDLAVFLASSMPIRDANLFLTPDHPIGPIIGNRGLSGIDGNIATVVGLTHGLRQPVVALLGDLACLHDLNSLALLKDAAHPVCLIVINNGGGGIFSFLPISQKKDVFERFWAAAHSHSFAQAASLFHIPHHEPSKTEDLKELLQQFSRNPTTLFIEIRTERQANIQLHQEIIEEVKRCLIKAPCPL